MTLEERLFQAFVVENGVPNLTSMHEIDLHKAANFQSSIGYPSGADLIIELSNLNICERIAIWNRGLFVRMTFHDITKRKIDISRLASLMVLTIFENMNQRSFLREFAQRYVRTDTMHATRLYKLLASLPPDIADEFIANKLELTSMDMMGDICQADKQQNETSTKT